MRLVRQAGRELGEVLASSVNFFNPGVIVIGGDIAHADEHLLAGVREVVYRRACRSRTRSLRIVRSAARRPRRRDRRRGDGDRARARARRGGPGDRRRRLSCRASRGRARPPADRARARTARSSPSTTATPTSAARTRRARSPRRWSASGSRARTGAASSCGWRPTAARTLGLHLGMAGRIVVDEPPAHALLGPLRARVRRRRPARAARQAAARPRGARTRTSPTSARTPPRSAATRSASGSAAAARRSRRGCSTRA